MIDGPNRQRPQPLLKNKQKYMKTIDSGNFAIRLIEGRLRLDKMNDNEIEVIKENGYSNILLLSASYQIHNGTLYLEGVLHASEYISGGEYGLYNYRGSEDKINQKLEKYFIGEKRVKTINVKKWFKVIGIEKEILRGSYIKKIGSFTIYKTNDFLIVE